MHHNRHCWDTVCRHKSERVCSDRVLSSFDPQSLLFRMCLNLQKIFKIIVVCQWKTANESCNVNQNPLRGNLTDFQAKLTGVPIERAVSVLVPKLRWLFVIGWVCNWLKLEILKWWPRAMESVASINRTKCDIDLNSAKSHRTEWNSLAD